MRSGKEHMKTDRCNGKADRCDTKVEKPDTAVDTCDAKADGCDAQTEAKTAGLEAKVAELEAGLAERDEQLAELASWCDTWRSKATAIHDQYLRAKADMDGFRKRTERDFEDRLVREKSDFLRELLEVADNFRRFLSAAEKSGADDGERGFDAFVKGVIMIEQQFMETLRKEGVEPIESPVGRQMDPAFHEAVAAQEDGGEHGTVVTELQRGYVYKGLVLRPTKVKVVR